MAFMQNSISLVMLEATKQSKSTIASENIDPSWLLSLREDERDGPKEATDLSPLICRYSRFGGGS